MPIALAPAATKANYGCPVCRRSRTGCALCAASNVLALGQMDKSHDAKQSSYLFVHSIPRPYFTAAPLSFPSRTAIPSFSCRKAFWRNSRHTSQILASGAAQRRAGRGVHGVPVRIEQAVHGCDVWRKAGFTGESSGHSRARRHMSTQSPIAQLVSGDKVSKQRSCSSRSLSSS